MKEDTSHHTHKHDNQKEYIKLGIIISVIFILSLASTIANSNHSILNWMRNFMGYFFVIFSLFKFISYADFINTFRSYDVLAMKYKFYGYVYPFIELLLGFFYIISSNAIFVSFFTIILMGVSLKGIMESMNKKIKCACLGTVVDLPLSKVSFIEDLLMLIMALMLIVMTIFQ